MGEGLGRTHYNWQPYVRSYIYDRVLPHVRATFGYQAASANTYYDHPTGWGLDDVSVDFWSPNGRGYPIAYYVGEEISYFVWNDPYPPWIRWTIWQGVIWVCPVPGDASQCYWYYYEDPYDQHFDHVHFTFYYE